MQIDNNESSNLSAAVCGKRIKSANSSLTCFAIELTDGQGLLLQASGTDSDPHLTANVQPASALPPLSEAVCRVDWNWISGSTIRRISITRQKLRLELDPSGPLTVTVGIWQADTFLTFMPYRPAK